MSGRAPRGDAADAAAGAAVAAKSPEPCVSSAPAPWPAVGGTGESGEEVDIEKVPVLVPSPPNSVSDPHLPADLVEIIAAWNTLPEAVRAGVLAMVRATKQQGHAGS